MTQAALPILREQGSGHILQVSSIGGVNAFPIIGIYHASKWALEGFSQALAGEVAEFGIHVTLVEPAGFSTDWGGPSAVHAEPLAAYDGVRRDECTSAAPQLARSPATPRPPARRSSSSSTPTSRRCALFFGDGALAMIRAEYERRLESWERWDELGQRAQGNAQPVAS